MIGPTRSLPTLLALVPALAGCLAGDGRLVDELRPIEPFLRLRNASPIKVTVVAAARRPATLRCDENLLPYIDTRVVGGTLEVTTSAGRLVQPSPGCVLTVATDSLVEVVSTASGGFEASGPFDAFERVESSGSGRVVIADLSGSSVSALITGSGPLLLSGLQVDEFAVTARGAGNGVFSGTARAVVVTASGAGDLDAAALPAEEVRVDASGSGTVRVHATVSATVRLSGSGDVVVTGGGTLDALDEGSGEVRTR